MKSSNELKLELCREQVTGCFCSSVKCGKGDNVNVIYLSRKIIPLFLLLVNAPHVSSLGGEQRCVYSLNIKLEEIKERKAGGMFGCV